MATAEPVSGVSGALALGAPAVRGQGAGASELASEPKPTESMQQLKEELEEIKKFLRSRGGIIYNTIIYIIRSPYATSVTTSTRQKN